MFIKIQIVKTIIKINNINILKQPLELYTKESPFKIPDGNIYKKIDGVAMGSPLDPCFENFYLGNLECKTFQNINFKPHIYGDYVNDIFL